MPSRSRPPRSDRRSTSGRGRPSGPGGSRSRADEPPSDPVAVFRESVADSRRAGDPEEAALLVGAVSALAAFTAAEAESPDPGPLVEPFFDAASLVADAFEETGAPEEAFVHVFLPRLPFDVLLGGETPRTLADVFLDRYDAVLRQEEREGVRALIAAEDTLCRVEGRGDASLVVDVLSGRALPGPAGVSYPDRPFWCRLVTFRGLHVPLVVDPEEEDPSEAIEAAEQGAAVASEFLAEEGIRLATRAKGRLLGFLLATVAARLEEEEEAAAGRPVAAPAGKPAPAARGGARGGGRHGGPGGAGGRRRAGRS